MDTFVIYKALNTVNGNFYIGATNHFQTRKSAHIWDAFKGYSSCKIFHKALRKYGVDVFEWSIIDTASSAEELMQKEIEAIAKFKPKYNCTRGGQGVIGAVRTLEWKQNQSKALKGRPGPKAWLGKKIPREYVEKSLKTRRERAPAKVEGILTQSRLKEIVHYDPETGHFTRLLSAHKWAVGMNAGAYESQSNTVRVTIDGTAYQAHNLAWFYMYGEWKMVLHKNGDRSDNRLENLELGTKGIIAYRSKTSKRNKLGIKGVSQDLDGKFCARITFNKKTYQLGRFSTIDEASQAYQSKFKEFYP